MGKVAYGSQRSLEDASLGQRGIVSEPSRAEYQQMVCFQSPKLYEEKNLVTGGWATRSHTSKCIKQEQFVSSSLSSVTLIYL